MSNHRYAQGLVLVIACLLIAASLVMAQESEKPPIKLGGAIGVTYAFGSYGSDDNPHRRGDKVGDADLDIFRLRARDTAMTWSYGKKMPTRRGMLLMALAKTVLKNGISSTCVRSIHLKATWRWVHRFNMGYCRGLI